MSNSTRPVIAQPLANRNRLALLGLLLFAFALRVVALDKLGMAYDETASALMARATPQAIIEFHWHAAFEHPPVWVLLVHGWSLLTGQSEFALRLLPAFAGTAMVVMLWRLVRLIWPNEPRLAFASALLTAIAPILVYYSQEARMYTLVVLLMLVATYLILKIRLHPTWPKIFAFWLVCWFMLGLHYYAALALAIQAAVLGLDGLIVGPVRRVPWGNLFIAYLGALLPVVAWMLFAPGFHTTLEVVLDMAGETPVTWHYFLGDLWRELSFGAIRWQPDFAVWGYAVAPVVALGILLSVLRREQSPTTRIGTWIVLAIVLLPILISTIALRTLVPRYILWIVPFLYTLAAVLSTSLWRRHWLAGTLVLLLVIGIDTLALQHYFGPYRKSEYREMTTHLQSRGNPQQEILLLEAPRQHLPAKYYLSSTWQMHPMPTLPLPDFWPVTAPPLVPEDEDDRILNWLAEYQGLWVSYTSESEVDQGEFLAKYLTAVAYREHCTQWLDVRLCHYVSPHHLAPQPLTITPALFGNELALTGAQAAIYHPTVDTTTLLVQLDWLAQHKPTVDYKVSLRLVAPDGSTLETFDDYPIGPLLVPTTWNAEDRKPGYYALGLPPNLPAGRYQLLLGLYDASSLAPTPFGLMPDASPALETTTPLLTLAEVQVGDTIELLSPQTP